LGIEPRDKRLVLRLLAEMHAARGCEALDEPEPGVVPGSLVLLPGIPQSDDESNQDGYFLSFFSPPLSAAALSPPAALSPLSPPLPSAAASPSLAGAACSVV